MIKAAILAGNEHPDLPRLVQLLQDHPDVELVAYADNKYTGTRLSDIYPSLTGETDLVVTDEVDPGKADVVFLATDAEGARNFMSGNLGDELFVIDMTGAYRDNDNFVQGIPELNRKAMVRGARYVAMPDTTTTAIALALLPFAKNMLLASPIHVNVVGDNHKADSQTLTANILPDDTSREVKKAMVSLQNTFSAPISGIEFTGDIAEGMMSVIMFDTDLDVETATRMFNDFYDDHSFTFVVDSTPDIEDVRDTNKCFIHLSKKDDTLYVSSVIDTDMKGGAGNAVHAMNLLFGLIEKVGL